MVDQRFSDGDIGAIRLDPKTQDKATRKICEGHSTLEAIRCLKSY